SDPTKARRHRRRRRGDSEGSSLLVHRRPRHPRPTSRRRGDRDARREHRWVLRVSAPRILAIMGSGETAPTMAKVHRGLLDRFGDEPAPVAIVDTPYGFQENADELSSRTVEFFGTNVGRPATVASYRSR